MVAEYSHHRSFRLLDFFPPPVFLSMPAVGIDISDNSLKFLEFRRGISGLRLGRFGEVPISEGAVVGGEVVKEDILAEALRELRQKHRLSFVRASLPEEKAYLFQTTVPEGTGEASIKTVIEFKLEEHVPLSPHEAVFDFTVLRRDHAGAHMDVSVTVYPRKIVAAYAGAFRRAGLVPLSFDIEAQATARALLPPSDMGTYFIVDFGETRTGLSIVSGGALTFTSTLEVSGQPLTEAIQRLAPEGGSPDQFKNEVGIQKSKEYKELTEAFLGVVETLKNEIQRFSTYWRERVDEKGERVKKVEGIILCGGNAGLAGLPEYLSAGLGIPVTRGNVWTNAFSFDDYIPELDFSHSLGYATAAGLALPPSEEIHLL